MLQPRDATRRIERRHGGEPLSDEAADIDVFALHMHNARCPGNPCNGPDDADHLRASVILEDVFDYGFEVHRVGVDCVVRALLAPEGRIRTAELLGHIRRFGELSRCAERADLSPADRALAGAKADGVFAVIERAVAGERADTVKP